LSLLTIFKQMKADKKKLTVVTSYDNWSAKIINKSNVDAILVGDCVGMVAHGESNTIFTDMNMLALHVRAVSRGAPDKLIIAAMPFMSIQKGLADAMNNVELLMRAGAQAIKIEGYCGNEEVIQKVISSGIPVIGHVGLKPTHHYMTNGFKVQGKIMAEQQVIMMESLAFEKAGAVCVVLEAVPRNVGAEISKSLEIPVVGVGAGLECDGQALVLQDMLGLIIDFKPKFVRVYLEGAKLFTEAINKFVTDVREKKFPNESESYKDSKK
jgi:3-methyl-2-oxobutanoate hydroxymethyltransferase